MAQRRPIEQYSTVFICPEEWTWGELLDSQGAAVVESNSLGCHVASCTGLVAAAFPSSRCLEIISYGSVGCVFVQIPRCCTCYFAFPSFYHGVQHTMIRGMRRMMALFCSNFLSHLHRSRCSGGVREVENQSPRRIRWQLKTYSPFLTSTFLPGLQCEQHLL